MKMRLNDDYTIALPIEVCEPLNADFDGDTIAIHLVEESAAQETYERMSPRYVNIYKKTNEPIYRFTHETLNGGALATEFTYEDPEELENPKEFYTDYTELLKDVEVHKKFPLGKPIIFTGKIGSVEYQSKVTTYGRLRVSKIIDADIDKIGIFEKPFERLSAKSASKLSLFLYQFPDGVEKIRELQKYFLMVVTKAGVVTFDFSTLWVDTDTKTYKKICEIADSPELTDKQKLLEMNEAYKQYQQEVEESFNKDLKNELSRANRVKLNSITAMNMPSLIISGVDEKPIITRSTLLSGFTEEDFQYHAIENRSLQSIKVSGVPSSGSVKCSRKIALIAGIIELNLN